MITFLDTTRWSRSSHSRAYYLFNQTIEDRVWSQESMWMWRVVKVTYRTRLGILEVLVDTWLTDCVLGSEINRAHYFNKHRNVNTYKCGDTRLTFESFEELNCILYK
jgi:hypothetical protein